jgi:hypothetical protein
MHSPLWSSPLGRLLAGVGMFSLASWALAAAAFLTWSPDRGLAAAAIARLVDRGHQVEAVVATVEGVPESPCASTCDETSGFSYSTDSDDDRDGFSWAVMDSDGSVTIDNGDAREFRAHARRGQPMFWFRDGGHEYWVQDRAIVEEVRRATTHMRDLGREMGKLGAEMGRHGADMGRLGGRMGAIGARLGMLEVRIASNPGLSQDERDRQRAEIDQLRDQMNDLQQQLNGEQGEHARSQRELSRRMSELSAQHEAALREARAQVREISVRARRQGKAERPHANA